jgi:hypothetical protein
VDSRAAAVQVAAKYLAMGAVSLALATASPLFAGVGGFGQIKVLGFGCTAPVLSELSTAPGTVHHARRHGFSAPGEPQAAASADPSRQQQPVQRSMTAAVHELEMGGWGGAASGQAKTVSREVRIGPRCPPPPGDVAELLPVANSAGRIGESGVHVRSERSTRSEYTSASTRWSPRRHRGRLTLRAGGLRAVSL